MSAATPATPETPAAPKKGPKKVMILVVALASLGGGAAFPMVMGASKKDDGEAKKPERPAVNVPFGEVTVNLSEERGPRYLRLKIVLKIEGPRDEEEGVKVLGEFKPAMKTWLIAHLSGKSSKDIQGSVGVKKLRREIQEEFDNILTDEEHASGKDKKSRPVLKDVLFEDYIVQ